MSKKSYLLSILGIVFLFSVLIIVGYSFSNSPSNPKNVVRHNQITPPIDYGNGVYFFSSTGANFGNTLSDFLERNKDLEVVAIAGDDSGGHGSTNGYFVVTKTK